MNKAIGLAFAALLSTNVVGPVFAEGDEDRSFGRDRSGSNYSQPYGGERRYEGEDRSSGRSRHYPGRWGSWYEGRPRHPRHPNYGRPWNGGGHHHGHGHDRWPGYGGGREYDHPRHDWPAWGYR